MASVKSTFTLDLETVARLNETASRLHRSKSAIVREAIHDYSERADRLSESERRRMLAAFDDLVPKIPERPIDEVEAELKEIREARRHGGRGSHDGHRL
jgi:predicted transcriptional regulator